MKKDTATSKKQKVIEKLIDQLEDETVTQADIELIEKKLKVLRSVD